MVARRSAVACLGLLLAAFAAIAQHTTATVSPGAFGSKSWRENGLAPGSLPLTGNQPWDVRLATDGHLYYWSGTAWVDLTAAGSQGAQGDPGPQGPAGPAGAAASVAVGSTTTGAPGTSAAVTNSGSSSAAILNFTIPRGDTGADGADGATGPAGADGAQGPTGTPGAAGADGIPRTIQDEGVDLTQRLAVNFAGTGVTCADDAGGSRTTCTVPGGLTNPLAAGSVGTNALQVVQAGTGLWQPAANVLGLAANGIEALRLNSATNGVNYVSLTPRASGSGGANGPVYACVGADASVDCDFNAQGPNSRFNFQINSSTVMDLLNDGSIRPSGSVNLNNGKFVGGSGGNTAVQFNNGGSWVEVKGNGVIGVRVDQTAVYSYTKTVTAAAALTIADNGDGGTRAAATLTPATSYSAVTCSDANGCDVTMSETGAVSGQLLRVVCLSASVCGFADTAGVTELAGAADLGQYDSLSLLYVTDRWVEVARSNN